MPGYGQRVQLHVDANTRNERGEYKQIFSYCLLFTRLHLTKYQTVLTRAFFNTSLLEPQKPDFSQKKATKVKDHEAPRSQRSKKIWLGKFFLFDFSPNWTILSHLAKVFFRPFLAF